MPIPTAGTVRHITPMFNLSRAVNGMRGGMTLKQLENRAIPRFTSTPQANASGEYFRQCAGHALGNAADVMTEAKANLSDKRAAALDKAVAWMTPGPGGHFGQIVLNRLTALGAVHAGVCAQLEEQQLLTAQATGDARSDVQTRVDALVKARDTLKASIVTIGLKAGAGKEPATGIFDGDKANSYDVCKAIKAGQACVIECMKTLGTQPLMDGIARAVVTEPLLHSIEARLPDVHAKIMAGERGADDLMQAINKLWADKTEKVMNTDFGIGDYYHLEGAIMDLMKVPDYVIQPQPGSKEPADKPPGLDAPPAIPQALLDKAGPGGGVFYNNSPQHVVVNMDGLLQDLFGKLEHFGGVPGAKQPQLLEICNLMKSVFDQHAENLIKLGALQERARIDADLIRRQADELSSRDAEMKDLRTKLDDYGRLSSFVARGNSNSCSSSSSASTSSLSVDELRDRLQEVDDPTIQQPQNHAGDFHRGEPEVQSAQAPAFEVQSAVPLADEVAPPAAPFEAFGYPEGVTVPHIAIDSLAQMQAEPRTSQDTPFPDHNVAWGPQWADPDPAAFRSPSPQISVQDLADPPFKSVPGSDRIGIPNNPFNGNPFIDNPFIDNPFIGNPFIGASGAGRYPLPEAPDSRDSLPDLRGDDEVQRGSQGDIPTQQALFGRIPRVRFDLSPQFRSTTLESERNWNPASGVSREIGTHADTTLPSGVTGFAGFYDSYLRELSKPSEDRDVREFNENGKATSTLRIQEAKQPMLKPSDVLKYEFERNDIVRNLTHRDGKAPPTQPIDPGLVSEAHQDNSLGDLFRRNPGVDSVSSLISALNSKRDEVESPVSSTSFANEEDLEGDFNEAFKGVDEMEFRSETRANARTVADLKSLFERSASRDSGIGGDEAVAKANAGVDPNGHLHFAAFDKKIDQLNALGRTPRRRVQFAGV